MYIGYARISTADQRLDMQIDALKRAGCDNIFTDVASGAKKERAGLEDCLRFMREGEDVLVVWKLDRLGRSLSHLLTIMDTLQKKNIGIKSLTEGIDTTTPLGRMFFQICGVFAEFERNTIRERVNTGLEAARARGLVGGRHEVIDEKKLLVAQQLLHNPTINVKSAAAVIGVGRSTLYRKLKKEREGK